MLNERMKKISNGIDTTTYRTRYQEDKRNDHIHDGSNSWKRPTHRIYRVQYPHEIMDRFPFVGDGIEGYFLLRFGGEGVGSIPFGFVFLVDAAKEGRKSM